MSDPHSNHSMHQRLDFHHDRPFHGFLNSGTTNDSIVVADVDASAATAAGRCFAKDLACIHDLLHIFLTCRS